MSGIEQIYNPEINNNLGDNIFPINSEETPSKPKEQFEETLFTDLQELNKGDRGTRRNNIQKFFNDNNSNIDAFVGSPEYQQLLKDARRNYNSQNKELAIKTNFALQVYARYELGDKDISIDGMSGKQTETVLRFIQSEGIEGPAINIKPTPEQEQKFAQYRAYRNERLLTRSAIVENSIEGGAVTETNNNNTPDYSKESNILAKNSDITKSIDELPPKDSSWLNDKNILTKDDIKEAVILTISDPILAEGYTNYIYNGMQGTTPVGVNHDEALKIHNQAIENKKNQINSIPQRESYMACIKSFGNLLENFSTNPEQQAQWLKMLNEQASSTFDLKELSVNVPMGSDTVSFFYDLDAGKISVNALIYKDETKTIHTQKNNNHRVTIIDNIPTRSSLEKNMQDNILERIDAGMPDMIDIQDTVNNVKVEFSTSMLKHRDTISKTIAGIFIQRDMLSWVGVYDRTNASRKSFSPNDPSDLYKLFDIVDRTIHNKHYNTNTIVSIGGKLAQIQSIAQEKYTDEKNIADDWAMHLKPEELQKSINTTKGDFGLYMLLAECTPHTTTSSDNYRIIQPTKIEELIKYHNTNPNGGFGNITHKETIATLDQQQSHYDAEELLKEIHMV